MLDYCWIEIGLSGVYSLMYMYMDGVVQEVNDGVVIRSWNCCLRIVQV